MSTKICSSPEIHKPCSAFCLSANAPHKDKLWFFPLMILFAMIVSGCGSGGYPGGGIVSLSASSVTIDAGQAFSIQSTLSGNPNVTWALSGPSCSGSGCGTVSSNSDTAVTYTAPASVAAPIKVTLTAEVAGTSNRQTVSITVNPAPVISGTPPNGTVGTPYSATLTVTGGTQPVQWSIAHGTLPDGLSFNTTTGVISGTPTTAGSSSVTVQITDSSDVPDTVTAQETIVITSGSGGSAGLAITGTPPNGTVGVPYSTTFSATGGSQPYTWSLASGTLPSGLTLDSSAGTISGTPTAAGTSGFTLWVQDSTGATATAAFTITINNGSGSSGTLTFTAPPSGTVGVAYSGSVGVSGGKAPYTCTISGLPAGLTANSCEITGTPTVAGTSALSVTATDSSTPAITTTGTVQLVINSGSGGGSGSLTLTAPPSGTVNIPYNGSVGVSGGTAPYTCTISGLPAGLTSNSCSITGTPTAAGTSTLTVTATDSSNPARTTTGTVPLTIGNSGGTTVTLTLTPPADATVGSPYSGVVGVSGGTAPYTCSITGLPQGLTSNSCAISGTPTSAGTATLTVTATDSSTPAVTTTGTVPLTINPAAVTLTISSPATATVNVPYTGTVGVSGGKAPYSCVITGLPAGLTTAPNSCTITGTPTVAGTTILQVTATDSSSPAVTTKGTAVLVVNPPAGSLTIGALPSGTVNTAYSTTVSVSGGTGPYTCVITGLPAGLTANSCTVTGTPTIAGTVSVTIKATDSTQPTALTTTATEPLVINAAPGKLTLSAPADATQGTPYNGVVGVSGGTSPYTCQIAGLPPGLTANSCAISGTPTVSGTSTLTVSATDSSNPALSVNGTVPLVVNPPAKLTLSGTLPNPVLNQAYSQQLQASGGIQPYSFSLQSGQLPAGLTLSADGTISGTPTQPGASVFTVQVTDTETPPQTATAKYTLIVTYPTGPNNGELKGPYAYLFQGYDSAVLGTLAYQNASVGSFTADGQGLITTGEQDSNHQTSGYTHNTLFGTYEIGADNRGMVALTTLDASGAPVQTVIYAISVQAPVAPATTTAQAQMIQFDEGLLTSSSGSATVLQQSGTYAAGMSGSYVFGLSGQTACLISCSVGISGPAAEVGQIAFSGTTLTGEMDANIAATNYTSVQISGTTKEAADGNGRMSIQLGTSANAPSDYPTNFVTYAVNAQQAFILSADTHTTFILLDGSAQLQQTPGSYDTNSSLSGAMLGYEDSQANPQLLGTTLQSVLNVSSATVFRAVATNGTCNTTNVDNAGLTSLLNGLSQTLQAILGTYSSTGNSSCTVASNGRGVLDYPNPNGPLSGLLGLLGLDQPPPPRVFYLSAPNTGYFLETGYAGLGNLVAQTGSPYNLSNFDGTFVYGTLPSGTAASIATSGYLHADGNGNINTVTDLAVGVGSLNPLLTLGAAGNGTYQYSPNLPSGSTIDPATVGRYTYGTDVIYEISPGRFVLIDTNSLTTSPTITLLY